jgi:hypothetical protein
MYVHATQHYNRTATAEKEAQQAKTQLDQQKVADQAKQQQDYYNGILSQQSNALQSQARQQNLNTQNQISSLGTQANTAYQQQLGANQALSASANAQLSATRDQQAQAQQAAATGIAGEQSTYGALVAALNKPRLTNFNPSFFKPDYGAVGTSLQSALASYNKGLDTYNQYNPGDTQYNDQKTNLISQYHNQLSDLQSTAQGASQFYTKPGGKFVDESLYPGLVQNLTDFNNQVQSKYQGLLSTIANLGNLGTEIYNQGVAKRGELTQARLAERSSFFANQAQNQSALLSSRAEQRGASVISNQRQRTKSSGMLSYRGG